MKYHLTPNSANRKTGPIAVTTSSAETCPTSCGLKGFCYASGGKLVFHWRKVTAGKLGAEFVEHIRQIKQLPIWVPIRLNQAGDLPGNGKTISKRQARALITAAGAAGRVAWGYTHYRDRRSLEFLASLPNSGAVINVSSDNPTGADRIDAALPRVTVIESPEVKRTPAGTVIVHCPAQARSDVSCGGGRGKKACGGLGGPLCARRNRGFIIGFTPNGNWAAKVRSIAGS
jgi:hypothetical protein